MIKATDARIALARQVARLFFCTMEHIQYWAGDNRHPSRVYEMVNVLVDAGLIEKNKTMQPYIYSLTRQGYRFANLKAPTGSRYRSWSAITHRCYANTAEIRLRSRYPQFQWLSHPAIQSLGLFPAFGEHFGRDGNNTVFCLVDDYNMDSSRISHALTRNHKPSKRFFDFSYAIPKWPDVASLVAVATISESQADAHKDYMKKHGIKAAMIRLEQLW